MAKTALCIGINDYPGTASDLHGCVNDATDWQAELDRRGFATALITDKKATKEAMLAEMRKRVRDAKADDLVVFTYSGHGTWQPDLDGDEPDQRDEALCPWDIAEHGALLDDDLYDIFTDHERGVRVVLISDSCHSGTLAKFAPQPLDGAQARAKFLPPSKFLSPQQLVDAERVAGKLLPKESRTSALVMAGCQDTEYSYDAEFGGRANGAFTYAALKALKGLKPNATYRDWYLAIRASLPAPSYPQSPNLQATRSQKAWPILT
jgi:uncharacterized caspase-like protein